MKTGATLNRGASKQDYETPDDFIQAVVKRFGSLNWDLAASDLNYRGQKWFDKSQDSLTQNWSEIKHAGNLWLNPPFANITPWAKKCSEYSGTGKILFLVPASVGSNWFKDYVYYNSTVIFLNGRITFKDCIQPYPKDCMLCVFENKNPCGQIEVWKWNNPKPN